MPRSSGCSEEVTVLSNKYLGRSELELLSLKESISEKLKLSEERNSTDKAIYESMRNEGRVEAEQVWLQSLEISGDKIIQFTEELKQINEALETYQ